VWSHREPKIPGANEFATKELQPHPLAELGSFPWGANGFIGQNFNVVGSKLVGKWAKFPWILQKMFMGWGGDESFIATPLATSSRGAIL
jgi:hypothetical protein